MGNSIIIFWVMTWFTSLCPTL